MVGSESITQIDGDKRQLIGGDEVEYNYGPRKLLGISSLDAVVKGARRERIEWDLHRHTVGARKERVDGDASCLVYQGRQEKVGQSFARESGGETHLLAGKAVVGEAPDITVQGPGGFLRIDATGVTISGMTVDINVSGSAGHGHGSHPREVAEAIEAKTKTGVVWDVAEFADHAGVAALRERFADKALDVEATSLRSLELVRFALSSDVSTPPGGAVFWSGGDLAGAGADQLAAERTNAPVDPTPSKRLEGTPGGAGLVTAVKAGKDDWAVQQPAWSAISKKLAVNASGPVTVVVSYYPLKNSAIFREEVKLLAANPKVTSIKAVTIAKHPNGDPILGPKGEYTLVPVSLKDVLAPPPPPPPFSPPTS
jgi:type VI secretion system secreted protein VgrG